MMIHSPSSCPQHMVHAPWPRSYEPDRQRGVIRPKGIIGFLCTLGHEAPALYIRKAARRRTGAMPTSEHPLSIIRIARGYFTLYIDFVV
jgi:hypothetical protein